MSGRLAFWPPPWQGSSGFWRAMACLWFLAVVPVTALAVVVAVPVAIVSKLTGWGAKAKRSREEVCRTIEEFVDGSAGAWDWDDFTSVPDADPILEDVRRRCVEVSEVYPPGASDGWCGPKGREELRRIAQELRRSDGQQQRETDGSARHDACSCTRRARPPRRLL